MMLIALLSFSAQLVASSFVSKHRQVVERSIALENEASSHKISMRAQQHHNDINMQCCNEECDCSYGLCIPLAISTHPPVTLASETLSKQAVLDSIYLKSLLLSFIYRPPITL